MTSIVLNTACRHFRGSRPCTFNKLDGSECATCRHTSEYRDRILFVKLDAIGDVLRTASVLPAIIARYDSPYIAWVTRQESEWLQRLFPGPAEAAALERKHDLFDGPNTRLLSWQYRVIDPVTEERALELYLGPVSWFQYTGMNQRLQEQNVLDDAPLFERYVDLDRLLRREFRACVCPRFCRTVSRLSRRTAW